MLSKKRIGAGLWLLLAAWAPGTSAAEPAPYRPIAAEYETRVIQLAHRPQAQNRRWHLLRADRHIETWDAEDAQRHVWQRSPAGEVSYAHVFPAQQRVVDYAAGDLRALGRYPDWAQLAEVLEPGLLGRLQKTGTVKVLGRTAQRYQGQLDGVDLEVHWLESERLPALVRRGYGDRQVSIHLLALHPQDRSPWPPAETAAYTRLDYSDLGDLEADPFVQSLPARQGAAPHRH